MPTEPARIIIAIDGYSGCGKSTTAKLLASAIGYRYIDTGAMYRATTLYFIRNHVRLTNPKEVEAALASIEIDFKYNSDTKESETFLNGLKVEREIRSMEVSQKVSPVSAIKAVRDAMVDQQRKMGKDKGVVMDGRDIGSNVFPQAELKVFMQADVDVRAQRRQKELMSKGETLGLEKIKANLLERDRIDTSREESPLVRAEDAHLLDTTELEIDTQVLYIIRLFEQLTGVSVN